MHARVFTFSLGPGSRDAATALADEAFKLAKTLKGFVSATYLIYDGARGDYGSITVWESEADAAAAGETLNKAFADRFASPPDLRNAEVYEPH
jgi:heme-degrading monooxygenase HmoA